jgi:hypothetical protein
VELIGLQRRRGVRDLGDLLLKPAKPTAPTAAPFIRESFRGVAEHSSVMSTVFVSSYFRK